MLIMKRILYICLLALGWNLTINAQVTGTIYRFDDIGTGLKQNEAFENGFGLLCMGDDDYSLYGTGKYSKLSLTKCIITRAMAIENWGAKYNYTFEATDDMDVNISIKNCVGWDGFARHSNHPNNTRNQYIIDNATNLDWVSRYYGSMILSLDGTNLPTSQKARPLAPEDYEPDGKTFNDILSDETLWESTLVAGGANDTLWLWPSAGGNNEKKPHYNDTPDYIKIHLTKGTHTLTVTSLCSGWDFDCLKIEDFNTSGIQSTHFEPAPSIYCNNSTIYTNSHEEIRIYNGTGQLMKRFHGQAQMPKGFYIVKCGDFVKKIFIK